MEKTSKTSNDIFVQTDVDRATLHHMVLHPRLDCTLVIEKVNLPELMRMTIVREEASHEMSNPALGFDVIDSLLTFRRAISLHPYGCEGERVIVLLDIATKVVRLSGVRCQKVVQ
jgi:hypothetical protein